MSAYPLGRLQEHDVRSRAFGLAERVVAELPAVAIRWQRHGPLFSQDVGCCTACAALGLMMTGPFSTGAVYTLADAHAFYTAETRLDGIRGVWPPDDTGSSGLAAMKTLRKWGLISAYYHAFSPRVAVAALARGPIAVGTVWLESMFTPRNGRIVVERSSPVAGGHEYVIDGWDPARGEVHMTNSWGGDWGEAGGATLAYEDLAWLLAQGGDAVQPTVTGRLPQ